LYAIRYINVDDKAQKWYGEDAIYLKTVAVCSFGYSCGAEDKKVLDWVDVEPHLAALREFGRIPCGSAVDNTLHPYLAKYRNKIESFRRSIDMAIKVGGDVADCF
jgi:sugar phosphate isomerase/epimerase